MHSKDEDMQQFTDAQTKQFQLRQPPSISPISLKFSTARLRCQGRSKSRIFNYNAFSKSDGKTGNLEMTRQFQWTSGHFLFPLSWRWMLTAWTSNHTCWSSNGHIIDLRLLHNCWCADTVFCGGLTGWWPHSTQSIPLQARIFHDTTPTVKCLFEARLQICNDLAQRFTLHLRPRSIHRAASGAIRNGSSLR